MSDENNILVFGGLVWDDIYSVARIPLAGEAVRADFLERRQGGSAANTAVGLADVGKKIFLVSSLGPGESNDSLLKEINKVDTRFIERIPDAGENLVMIYIDSDGERTIFSSATPLKISLDSKAFNLEKNLVFLNSSRIDISAFTRKLHERGSFVVSALNKKFSLRDYQSGVSDEQDIPDLLVGSKVDLTSEDIQTLYENKDNLASLELDTEIIITDGAFGSDFFGKEYFHIPAEKVSKVVDTTGAGDSYAAGVVLALSENKSIQEGMILGSRWAAATVQQNSSIPASFDKSWL